MSLCDECLRTESCEHKWGGDVKVCVLHAPYSDIVERLRIDSKQLVAWDRDYSDTLLSAANEIERLEYENRELRAQCQSMAMELTQKKSETDKN